MPNKFARSPNQSRLNSSMFAKNSDYGAYAQPNPQRLQNPAQINEQWNAGRR